MSNRPPKVKKPPPCRIDGILARDANKAVIFRRGPTDYWQLLSWDLTTDEIVAGDWNKGKVFPKKCDLSPNGEYLVVMLETRGYETRICQPPSLISLGTWKTMGTYNGGGKWIDNRNLIFNKDWYLESSVVQPIDERFQATLDAFTFNDEAMFASRLIRNGWTWGTIEALNQDRVHFSTLDLVGLKTTDVSEAIISESCFNPESVAAPSSHLKAPLGVLRLEKASNEAVVRRDFYFDKCKWTLMILDKDQQEVRRWENDYDEIQFLEIDHNGRVIFSDKGCLWAWPGFPDEPPIVIADLNDNKPPEHLLK